MAIHGNEALRNRWGILAVLFAVRLTMGFRFQSVAAVAPLLERELGVSLADIGVLIGLYFTPGVALALPGGAIGQRFGDKTTVLGALLLMLAGGLAMALSESWSIQVAGRLVAGTGGVMLNVQMTKMVTDWFAAARSRPRWRSSSVRAGRRCDLASSNPQLDSSRGFRCPGIRRGKAICDSLFLYFRSDNNFSIGVQKRVQLSDPIEIDQRGRVDEHNPGSIPTRYKISSRKCCWISHRYSP
jgi:hypothetical protein